MIGPVTTSDAFEASGEAGERDGIGEGTGALAGAEAAEAAFVVEGAIARSSLQPLMSAKTAAILRVKNRLDVLANLMLTSPSNPKSSTSPKC